MRDYELVFVLDPDLTSEKQKKQISKIKKIVTDLKGKVGKTDSWGKKELAYPIKKKKMGSYFFWELQLPVKAPAGLQKDFYLEETILRHLLVKKKKPVSRKKQRSKKKEVKDGPKSS